MAFADTAERPAPPARAGGAPFFSCRDIESYYGESYIVQGVSFDIAENEVVALLGRNGAGKTSTLRTLARAAEPHLTAGEIWLDGQALHRMKAHQAARAGVQLVPEDRRIIAGITVEENLILARTVEPRGWEIDRLYDLFPRLGERRRQEASTLSGGEQQMLAIARALGRNLKLLLLDEPYEGLAPTIVEEIEKTMAVIRRSNITTIIVEQNALAALRIADSAVILDMGEVVFKGTAQDVLDNEELREQYLAV